MLASFTSTVAWFFVATVVFTMAAAFLVAARRYVERGP